MKNKSIIFWIEDVSEPDFEMDWTTTTSRNKINKILAEEKKQYPKRKLKIKSSSKESWAQYMRRCKNIQW
jgi:hypothetical protein